MANLLLRDASNVYSKAEDDNINEASKVWYRGYIVWEKAIPDPIILMDESDPIDLTDDYYIEPVIPPDPPDPPEPDNYYKLQLDIYPYPCTVIVNETVTEVTNGTYIREDILEGNTDTYTITKEGYLTYILKTNITMDTYYRINLQEGDDENPPLEIPEGQFRLYIDGGYTEIDIPAAGRSYDLLVAYPNGVGKPTNVVRIAAWQIPTNGTDPVRVTDDPTGLGIYNPVTGMTTNPVSVQPNTSNFRRNIEIRWHDVVAVGAGYSGSVLVQKGYQRGANEPDDR